MLAMASQPTYDANMFSRKLDLDAYEALLEDPHHPFLNHAIADQIPAGSVFKIVPATAALQEGVINRFTTLNCPGRIFLPNKFAPTDASLAQPFYCWINLQHGGGHGPLTVVEALAQSCDIFFYQVGGGSRGDRVHGARRRPAGGVCTSVRPGQDGAGYPPERRRWCLHRSGSARRTRRRGRRGICTTLRSDRGTCWLRRCRWRTRWRWWLTGERCLCRSSWPRSRMRQGRPSAPIRGRSARR